jgi:proline iminopeptidase
MKTLPCFVLTVALLATSVSAVTTARRTLAVPDGTLSYRMAGSGRPILLLTGGPGHSGDYLDPVFEHLAATHVTILLDQRGTGRSVLQQADSSTITLAKSIDDLERLRIALGIQQWALFGHSWGGMLAMGYTAAYPDRVSELILVGSGGVSLASHTRIGAALDRRLTPTERDTIRSMERSASKNAEPETALALKKLRWNAYLYDRGSLAAVSARLTPRTYNADVSRLMLSNLEGTRYDLRKRLEIDAAAGRLPHAVLLIYGEADAWGLGTAAEITAAFPRIVARVIPHSGHFPWVESPVAFYRSVDAFIASH